MRLRGGGGDRWCEAQGEEHVSRTGDHDWALALEHLLDIRRIRRQS